MLNTPFDDTNAALLDDQAHNNTADSQSLSLAQLDRGNFKHGHIKLFGVDLSIRFARGTYGQTFDLLGLRCKINPVSHFAVCSKQAANQLGQSTPVLFGLRRAMDTVFAVPVQSTTDHQRRMFVLVMGADHAEDAKSIVTTVFWSASGIVVGNALDLWPEAVKAWVNGGFDPLLIPFNKPHVLLDLVQRNSFLLSDLWLNDADRAASKVAYTLTKYDPTGQMNEALGMDEACKMTDGDGVTGVAMDSTTVTYKRLDKLNAVLAKAMNSVGGDLQVVGDAATTEPKMKNGVLHVASQFGLSDGQSITVWMHNIDATPKKINPDDELTAWKYLLNKKDITVVVAPEGGQDLTMREVATRVMRLAGKNSAAFKRAQAKQETLKATDAQLDADIAAADATIADLQGKIDARSKPAQEESTLAKTDMGNGDSLVKGMAENRDGTFTALTLVESKTFKTRAGAVRWLAQRGLNPDGSRIASGAPDLEYRTSGMFTSFVPNTPEGEQAWREMAVSMQAAWKEAYPDLDAAADAKVPTYNLKQVIRALEDAGYTVEEAAAPVAATPEEDDALLANLGLDPAPEETTVPATNPDAEYLQAIVDGTNQGTDKDSRAKVREILVTAKAEKNTDIEALATEAVQQIAARVKAAAQAKLAEVA